MQTRAQLLRSPEVLDKFQAPRKASAMGTKVYPPPTGPTQEPALAPGRRVRVRKTGAEGPIVEISRRHRTADVDLGDGIVAEFSFDEIELVPGPN